MEPIKGIVYKNDIPPTLGVDPVGLALKFFGHDTIHLMCNRGVLYRYITNTKINPVEVNHQSFKLEIGTRRVTLILPKPVYGHGTIVLKKSEFLALLKT